MLVEQVSCDNQCFSRIQLALRALGKGIDIGLLANTTNTLESADVEGVLRS